MKKGAGSRKGSAFEREMCRRLSLWWSDNTEDDIFWKTPASGGRATSRMKRGKQTASQWGDISPTDHRGQLLTDLFIVEVKRGYGQISIGTIADLLDCTTTTCMWEKWINKVEKQCDVSGVPFWMIISKRNRREPIVCVSEDFLEALWVSGIEEGVLTDSWRTQYKHPNGSGVLLFYLLTDFLRLLKPNMVCAVLACRKK